MSLLLLRVGVEASDLPARGVIIVRDVLFALVF